MDLSWGIDLWDRLDQIISHSNASSALIDKSYKCFTDCHNVWTKAAHKQKRLLERLQTEIKESAMDEFTLTSSILGIINNLTSICNIKCTFQDSISKTSDDYLKKTHSQIKKQCNSWSIDKRKMEDDLTRERRKYDLALKRYREKYQIMIGANDIWKKSEDNRALSRSQIDMCQTSFFAKRTEYDESKSDYAVEITNFNNLQQTYFSSSVVNWAKKGEKLYEQRLQLLRNVANELGKFTKEMVKNLSYSITRFTDIAASLSFEKDAILLVQNYKTGDVPPGELQFIDLDNKQYSSKSLQNISDNLKLRKESSDSASVGSTSSFESNIRVQNDSMCAGSYSSVPISTNTRSEPGRVSVHNVKMRDGGKVINPEARFSFRKSNKIFRSATPWKDNSSAEKPHLESQKSLYQKRGRSRVKDSQPQQRSHSVSEMISNVFRSSLRLKSSGDINVTAKKSDHSPERTNKTQTRPDSSDFDTDSSCEEVPKHVAPEIVSTPADAVAMTRKNLSMPDFSTVDSSSTTVNHTQEQINGEEDYDYSYVGCCVSYHDFDSEDPSNNYLSFKAGDQFYILSMNDNSGWLFVETVGDKVRGYVPASYMETEYYDKASSSHVEGKEDVI